MVRNSDPPCERDLKLDSYQLWLADKYNIRRNDVFQKFEVERRLFPNLEEALEYAHSRQIEDDLKKAEENYRISEERKIKKKKIEKSIIVKKEIIQSFIEGDFSKILFMAIILILLGIFFGL